MAACDRQSLVLPVHAQRGYGQQDESGEGSIPGLERKDVAAMLGTTSASITELMSQAKKKKGAKKNATPKAKGR